MVKPIYYPNCSELIADFNIHDPALFYEVVNRLAKKFKWQFDPPLTVNLLERMKRNYRDIQIMVLDMAGKTTTIEYGDNGYDSKLGFRFDSGCNHSDSNQYGFFDAAIQIGEASIQSYDGGTTDEFEKWQEKYGH